ncbi:MAG: hypothetical protein ABSF80_08590 [Chitinispirillaceae bacterium]|jgi:hypothetical protein
MTPCVFVLISIGFSSVFALNSETSPRAYVSDIFTDSLGIIISEARKSNLPLAPLENKIKEGKAKERSSAEILAAVKNRKLLLEQLRQSNHGSIPDGYMKQLFALERKNQPIASVIEHKTLSTGSTKQAAAAAPSQARFAAEKSKDSSRTLPAYGAVKKSKDGANAILKQEQKPDKTDDLEEKLEQKAQEKAEKMEKSLEKKMEKIERKNER